MTSFSFLLSFVLSFLLLSCDQKTGKLAPQETYKAMMAKLDIKDVNLNVNLAADILFVVDDSGSMHSHQENLATNTALFTKSFLANTFLDFRIVISSTSGLPRSVSSFSWYASKPSSIVYRGPFDRNTTTLNWGLAEAFRLGTYGDAIESVFYPVKKILSEPSQYSGFYRQDAFLVLIFVTDAEDQSGIQAIEFKNFLIQLKLEPSKVIAYGVLAKTNSLGGDCLKDAADDPVKIENFIRSVGGSVYSLCEPNFGKYLADMGKDIVAKISEKILLPSIPLISTIKVRYGSQVIPNHPKNGWTYDPVQNALFFGYEVKFTEAKGAKMKVSYDIAD